MYNESHGPSLSRETKRKPALHHLTLHSSSSNDAQPSWEVSHYKSERDRSPVKHHFSDGVQLMQHIAEAANVPAPSETSETEGEN
jgi:hypothetical protein